jgi:hypothetical protein
VVAQRYLYSSGATFTVAVALLLLIAVALLLLIKGSVASFSLFFGATCYSYFSDKQLLFLVSNSPYLYKTRNESSTVDI